MVCGWIWSEWCAQSGITLRPKHLSIYLQFPPPLMSLHTLVGPHGTFSLSFRDSKPSWLPPAPLSILLCLFSVFFSTWALTVDFSEGNYVPSLFLVYTLFLSVPISITWSISCVLMTQRCMSSSTLFSQLQTLPISHTHTPSPTKCPRNHSCPNMGKPTFEHLHLRHSLYCTAILSP